jgi:hypothetical protein
VISCIYVLLFLRSKDSISKANNEAGSSLTREQEQMVVLFINPVQIEQNWRRTGKET